MAELSREEFLAHIEPLRADVIEVKQHLERQNGRLRTVERTVDVLKDRSMSDQRNRWIERGVGGLIAGLLGIKEFWFR